MLDCARLHGFELQPKHDGLFLLDRDGAMHEPATFSPMPSSPVTGLQTFSFTYSITDNATFAASVFAQISTDGTVNYDQLGNYYYNVISISGTRTEQSLINSSLTSTVFISSLMAPNIIATSNLAYITNNNRIYPQYPYLDRYGLAYTVTSKLGTVTQPELVDGSTYLYTNVVGVYIYRLDTLDEQARLTTSPTRRSMPPTRSRR